jgi:hypothetical protein
VVTIYFKAGHTAQIPGASKVAISSGGRTGPEPFKFQCLDGSDTVVAKFADHEMLGYWVGPDP